MLSINHVGYPRAVAQINLTLNLIPARFTSLKLVLDPLQRTTSSMLIQEVTFYGSIASSAFSALSPAALVLILNYMIHKALLLQDMCGVRQTGNLLSSDQALDGILGFGNSSSSMISQLASSGVVKKKFAHCLDSVNGGGIFAIGDVVQPKVNTTPLVLDQAHYNVNMEAVKVGNTVLSIPKEVFETGVGKGAIIDSGTTLSYFPEAIYEPLMSTITSSQNVNIQTVQEFSCFEYDQSIDEAFPTVTFQFENSLELVVYPHDYLFPLSDNQWCIGWLNAGRLSINLKDTILLGDLVLSNKLVLYDLENQVLGWTDYNCNSTIGIKDEKSGSILQVGSHDLVSSSSQINQQSNIMFLLLIVTSYILI